MRTMIWVMIVILEVVPWTVSAGARDVEIEGAGPRASRLYDAPISLNGRLAVEPEGVNQLAGVLPEKDPEVTEPIPGIVSELEGRHPRLLFSAGDITELNAFRNTIDGRRLWSVVHSYRNLALSYSKMNIRLEILNYGFRS